MTGASIFPILEVDEAYPFHTPRSGKKALLKKAKEFEVESQESIARFEDGLDELESENEDSEDGLNSDDNSHAEKIDWDRRVKQRVLLCASRGINHRQRHLMTDLLNLLPHSKKENKLDQKKNLGTLNEMAEMSNCNKVVYLESRKGTDLFMWLSNAPNGPSIKFEVLNVHTMDEMNMTGNHLKGSRSILSFDAAFDSAPHSQLMKHLLMQTFNVPKFHRRSKPFFDHVISFSWIEGKVWLRNYQICEVAPSGSTFRPNTELTELSLAEVGPRFVLDPIKIFQGSFGGLSLWENPSYLTPTVVRRALKEEKQQKIAERGSKRIEKVMKQKELKLKKDPLSDVFA